jgi:2-haloacid dehalogenase
LAKFIVFDLMGTLLDMSGLSSEIKSIFKGAFTAEEWLSQVHVYGGALNQTGDYRQFSHLAIAVLEMKASGFGVKLTGSDIHNVHAALQQLPPFSDVKKQLARLKKAGFRLAILSNSSPAGLNAQVKYAGIAEYFDQLISVHGVSKFKPAAEVYRFALQTLNAQPSEVLFVAAHHWDLLGASHVGLRTAFLKRPHQSLLPNAIKPDYVIDNLQELADDLLSKRASSYEAEPDVKTSCCTSSSVLRLAAYAATGLIATAVLAGRFGGRRV